MADVGYSCVHATSPAKEELGEPAAEPDCESHGPNWHVPTRRAALMALLLGLGLTVLFASCMPIGRVKKKSHSLPSVPNLQQGAIQQKSESASLIPLLLKVLKEMSEGIHGAVEMSKEVGDSYTSVKKLFKSLKESAHEFKEVGEELVDDLGKPIHLSMALKKQLHSLSAAQKSKLRQQLLEGLNLTSLHDLRPANTTGCNEDEELFEGLCYKRCAILTKSRKPVRASAFQCCSHEQPCEGQLDIEPRLCGGYAVGGSASGNGCAREPARCLQAEEFSAGLCYMRCSLLTYGMLPHRSTPDACCKSNSPLAMLELGSCDTDGKYDVGDKRGNSAASSLPHEPLE
mmetsp:Transcript_128311/g.256269  ORF Transcript_128311/g.256269 Transcript_128311/m.256269 type:complete len:344 (-) Transcript_128311:74-1105(-)|eukprot:CAMPEP_0172669610 /NCGR_PEP_ID=MMETSP1074-20121228/9789_1 /TAXON_ID=2916 /ORGANISM="Ceratium fusus, Strain PA161109" /LENGTH=343 /DNA_ID=CAMNT_0013486411 /DNA_START=45 /DNA_END=1076 /DNA_ORIENTATION=+